MNFQIDVTSISSDIPVSNNTAEPPATQITDLLQQILEVQKEILGCQRALLQAQDSRSRWRAFLAKWEEEFGDLPEISRRALPILEKTYGEMLTGIGDQLTEDQDSLESEFALREMLDRYGPQLAHLGILLSVIAPLADPSFQKGSES